MENNLTEQNKNGILTQESGYQFRNKRENRIFSFIHFPEVFNFHFPFQLYVREARRLIGEYTLTEHNITNQSQDKQPHSHNDSIAVGEFPLPPTTSQRYYGAGGLSGDA